MKRWFSRLACRTAGHKWSLYREERQFLRDGERHKVLSRFCLRHCQLPGSLDTRVVSVHEEYV